MEHLRPLIDAEFRARQSNLADLKRKEQDLHQRLKDLSARNAVVEIGGPVDPATLVGADLRWETWAEKRRADIIQRIARLRVDQERAMAELRRSFGRKAAVDALCNADKRTRSS
jgi:hypothetical protein